MLVVIGASGRTGANLCPVLWSEGIAFRPIVRDLSKWRGVGIPVPAWQVDLEDTTRMARALEDARIIVCCAHARHVPALLAAAPSDARLILLGSTRRYSQWRDLHGDGVREGEVAFRASGRAGVMLHPTMIYGATGEDNVQRLAALLRRLPVAPLPDGGRALVQPIHQADLTRCLMAAIRTRWDAPEAIVVAGPQPVAYRDFLASVARAAGQKPPPVLPVPVSLLQALAPLTRVIPGVPRVRVAELRRLCEDKAFDIAPMQQRLGVRGMSLEEGLARTFRARPQLAPSRGSPLTGTQTAEVPHAHHQSHR